MRTLDNCCVINPKFSVSCFIHKFAFVSASVLSSCSILHVYVIFVSVHLVKFILHGNGSNDPIYSKLPRNMCNNYFETVNLLKNEIMCQTYEVNCLHCVSKNAHTADMRSKSNFRNHLKVSLKLKLSIIQISTWTILRYKCDCIMHVPFRTVGQRTC